MIEVSEAQAIDTNWLEDTGNIPPTEASTPIEELFCTLNEDSISFDCKINAVDDWNKGKK